MLPSENTIRTLAATDQMKPPDTQINGSNHRPLRVLVIDHNETGRPLYSEWLEGHSVDVVGSLSTAVRQAQLHRYDVVLCDVVMPELHELRPIEIIEFCQRIQGAKLVAITDTEQCACARKTRQDLKDVVNQCCASQPQSLVIELMNDVDDLRQVFRGSS